MPSTPQVLPTVKVWDYVTDPTTGQPVPQGTPVTVTWKILQGSVTNPIVQAVPKSQTLYTDANGFWTMTVVPTDRLSPANSTYHVSDGYNSYDVNPVLAGYPGGDGWQALNIRVAPATAVLAPTGQTTGNLQVNGTLGVTGAVTLSALTTGQVVFPGAAGLLSGSANLFWDNANSRLGIGTNVPTVPLHVIGSGLVSGQLTIGLGATGQGLILNTLDNIQDLQWQVSGVTKWSTYNLAGVLNFFDVLSGANRLSLSTTGATIGGTLSVTGSFLSLGASPGELLMSGAGQAIIGGGTTGLAIWNNALGAKNIETTDTGYVTIRGGLTVSTGAVAATIGPAGIGQITAGALSLVAASTEVVQINTGTGISFPTDNTYDIGTSVSQRPRGLWLGTFIGIQGDRGAGIAGSLVLTNAVGIGNGANTNMQSPLKGTGGGPTSAILVTDWIKIYDGATTKWIPAFT